MNAPFIAAAIVGAVAPFVRAWAWGVPLWMYTWGMALRATLGAGLVTLLAGLIPLVAVDEWTAGAIGLAVGGGLMLLSARRHRHLRGIMLLSWRLADPVMRAEASQRLVERMEAARKLPPNAYARLALLASGPLSAVERWDDVVRSLAWLDFERLAAVERARVAQAMATAQLALGDLEAATAWVTRVERPAAEAGVERWLGASEALLLAVQGNADEALRRANEAHSGDDALGASYAIVRAHALASKGDDEGAEAELRAVQAIAGRAGLARAVRPVGPATDIARAMLTAR